LKNPRLLPITLAALGALAAEASTSSAQSLPSVRRLGRIVTKSATTVPSIAGVRELPHGRVLVNDTVARRLYLFDSALTSRVVLLDSTEDAGNSYGGSPGGIIAYRGDSTLFVDPSIAAMLLLDPSGRVARSVAVPNPVELLFLAGGAYGTPGFDARGHLVYRGSALDRTTPRPAGTLSPYPERDSAPIVGLNLITRRTDTIALFRIPRILVTVAAASNGQVGVTVRKDLLPIVDDWAVLPNGALALIRGGDFHIDWVDPNGKRSLTGRVPFPWRALSRAEKVAFTDSVRSAADSATAALKDRLAEQFEGTGMEPPEPIEPQYGPSTQLPDRFPAFEPSSTHADPEGNLWIRTTQRVHGEPVYYLANRKGTVIDRLQLPAGSSLAGFGRNNSVYLAVIDPAGGVRLERARVR
jgi:hypothetical protein